MDQSKHEDESSQKKGNVVEITSRDLSAAAAPDSTRQNAPMKPGDRKPSSAAVSEKKINSVVSRSNSLYDAKKISFFENRREDDDNEYDDEDCDHMSGRQSPGIDSPMVKSNFNESFEDKNDDEKEMGGFEVDCVSNELRLRAPVGSSQEGSKCDEQELRNSKSMKGDGDEEGDDAKSQDDISIDDVSEFSGEQCDERITDKSNDDFNQDDIENLQETLIENDVDGDRRSSQQ